ncbi:hypothetical protein AMTR_s00183p00034080 [Amborella trichopoda]|uniref:Uncharacterized protein n=1 Tax=Amborella trichopoda TaxID=13333 RepID=U5D8K7_AMBTC|nr:hypothetical protein AMTR_s00183p00034080 [Amborella trichopoda]
MAFMGRPSHDDLPMAEMPTNVAATSVFEGLAVAAGFPEGDIVGCFNGVFNGGDAKDPLVTCYIDGDAAAFHV